MPTGARRPHSLARAAGPLALGLLALGLYRTTLLPGVGWWDTAEFQVVGPLLGTAHPTGYPSYVILGWLASIVLAPVGEPALRMNLLSAILVAGAVAGAAAAGRILSGHAWIGLVVGAGFAVTPAVWQISAAADPHALHVALVVGLVLVLLRWERQDRAGGPRADRLLLVAAALMGVAAGNHGLTILLAPWLAAFVLVVEPGLLRRPRFVAGCLALAALVAVGLYLELPLRAGPFRAPLVYGHPERLDGLLAIVTGAQFMGVVRSPLDDPLLTLGRISSAAAGEFGPLAVLLPVAALATALRHPAYAVLSLPATLLTATFAASYENADIGRYDLGPIFFGWTWLGVLGGLAVERLASGARATLRGLAAGLVGVVLLGPAATVLPVTWATVDRSTDTTAAAWLDAVLPALAPGAVVVSWWSASTPLWYAQLIEGRRPDVWIVDDRTRLDLGLGEVTDVIDANLSSRPVYVIRARAAELAALAAGYELEPLDVSLGDRPWRVVRPIVAGVER